MRASPVAHLLRFLNGHPRDAERNGDVRLEQPAHDGVGHARDRRCGVRTRSANLRLGDTGERLTESGVDALVEEAPPLDLAPRKPCRSRGGTDGKAHRAGCRRGLGGRSTREWEASATAVLDDAWRVHRYEGVGGGEYGGKFQTASGHRTTVDNAWRRGDRWRPASSRSDMGLRWEDSGSPRPHSRPRFDGDVLASILSWMGKGRHL
ncbi:hypothetical protein C8Q80DRAFT_1208794 [Daedaleopsis nitida]|nr:hypothetical protein C8Q80DRAFT_1208794 [Daedaleopsis nitida]